MKYICTVKICKMLLDPSTQCFNTQQLVELGANHMATVGQELEGPANSKGIHEYEAECSCLIIRHPRAILSILMMVSLVTLRQSLRLHGAPFILHHGCPQEPTECGTIHFMPWFIIEDRLLSNLLLYLVSSILDAVIDASQTSLDLAANIV